MRLSPTKILHGLLYSTPILLLTLAACGGGGGGEVPSVPFASAYTVGGTVAVSGVGLVLQNNGSDNKTILNTDTNYTFATSVISGNNFNITVLQNPSGPFQKCTVSPAAASGVMPAYNVTTANVTCVNAYTIGGGLNSISGLTGTGLVLQNNGGDNLLIPAGDTGPYSFSTPLAQNDGYAVTVLTQPTSPAQTCAPSAATGNVGLINVTTVTISCITDALPVTAPAPDRFAYVVNNNNNNTGSVSSYTIAQSGTIGELTTITTPPTAAEVGTSSIAVDSAGQYAYVTNQSIGSSFGTINVFNIQPDGSLIEIDANSSIIGMQNSIVTGSNPVSIKLHPSGKFAYTVNKIGNSISGYTIDAASGALARIDLNSSGLGNDIPTALTPVVMAIDPSGAYAYVANVGSGSADDICGHGIARSANGCITAYTIDQYGILTSTPVRTGNDYIDTGAAPSSIRISADGAHLYVTNGGDNTISAYFISNGLLTADTPVSTGLGPTSFTIHPSGLFAYVVNTAGDSIGVYGDSSGTLSISPSQTVPTGYGSAPNSISIDSTGQYAYVVNSVAMTVTTYHINYDVTNANTGGDGALTPVGIPVSTGTDPRAVITAK